MRRITLLTNPDVCNLRCPLCFLNQRALHNCNARSAENGNGDCPPDNGRERFFYCNKERRAFGLGEMSIAVARAYLKKWKDKAKKLKKRENKLKKGLDEIEKRQLINVWVLSSNLKHVTKMVHSSIGKDDRFSFCKEQFDSAMDY